MKKVSKHSVDAVYGFFERFIHANFKITDLAKLFGQNIAVLSLKTTKRRWKVSELIKLFDYRGYRLTFTLKPFIHHNPGAPPGKKPKKPLPLPPGGNLPGIRELHCDTLAFLQDYIIRQGFDWRTLKETINYQSLYGQLKRDDMPLVSLLQIVAELNAELHIDVQQKVAPSRTRVGGIVYMTAWSEEIINL